MTPKQQHLNITIMSLKEQFKRISYVANVCRTENTTAEIQSMLNELDSTIADMFCEIYGIDEYESIQKERIDTYKVYSNYLLEQSRTAHSNYRKAIEDKEDQSVVSSFYGEWMALKDARKNLEQLKQQQL